MNIGAQQSPPARVARQLRTPVAVIVSRFPVVTETFILRELDALEQQGQPVTLVPLMKETGQLTHQAAVPWMERALYTPWFSPGMLSDNLRLAAQAPGKYARTLWILLRTHWQKPGILLRTLALFPRPPRYPNRCAGRAYPTYMPSLPPTPPRLRGSSVSSAVSTTALPSMHTIFSFIS